MCKPSNQVRLIVSPCDQKWHWLPHLLAIIRWIWKKFSEFGIGFFFNLFTWRLPCPVFALVWLSRQRRCCGRLYRALSVFPSLEVKLSWQANFSTSFRGFLDSHQENKQRLSWWAIPLAFGCKLWWLIKIHFSDGNQLIFASATLNQTKGFPLVSPPVNTMSL